jgi:hypothetical protein
VAGCKAESASASDDTLATKLRLWAKAYLQQRAHSAQNCVGFGPRVGTYSGKLKRLVALSDCTHDDRVAGDGIATKLSTWAPRLCSRFKRSERRPSNARQVAASLDALGGGEVIRKTHGITKGCHGCVCNPRLCVGCVATMLPVLAAALGLAFGAEG